jgi:hypothetical protein
VRQRLVGALPDLDAALALHGLCGAAGMTVDEALALSKAAHLAYLSEDRNAPQADYGLCERHVATALELRQQAHDLDPDHTASIWRDDEARWPHEELMDFYRRYPAIP